MPIPTTWLGVAAWFLAAVACFVAVQWLNGNGWRTAPVADGRPRRRAPLILWILLIYPLTFAYIFAFALVFLGFVQRIRI